MASTRFTCCLIADDLLPESSTIHVRGVGEVVTSSEVGFQHLFGSRDLRSEAKLFANGHGSGAQSTDTQARAFESDLMIERHGSLLTEMYSRRICC